MAKRGKDPLLSAAVLKVSLSKRGSDAGAFQEIYEGVLRDFALTDAQVEAFLRAHRQRVEALARGDADPGDGAG